MFDDSSCECSSESQNVIEIIKVKVLRLDRVVHSQYGRLAVIYFIGKKHIKST